MGAVSYVLDPFSSIGLDMQTDQLAAVAALSDAEVTVIAYVEAAQGDVDLALQWAIQDMMVAEQRFAEALRAVSHGYVRGELPPGAH